MSKVFDLFAKAPVIELDRPRKLVYGVLAVGHLEELYPADGLQKAWVEMYGGIDPATKQRVPSKRQWPHIVNFLWAMLQEDAEDHGEELTAKDVRRMLVPHDREKYKNLITETVAAYSPPRDPQKPAAKDSRGTGGGHGHGAHGTSDGPESGS